MSQVIVHEWVDVWLCAWVRELVARIGASLEVALVGNREIGTPKPGQLHIVIRNDGGTRHDLVLKDQQLGILFIAASVSDLPEVRFIADRVIAHMVEELPTDEATPVAHVFDVNGPYTVAVEDDSLRVYASMTLALVGVEIAP